MSDSIKKLIHSDEVYDVTAKEREVIEWRDKRRLELRNQYLKEIHNPNAQSGHLFDEQIQRRYTAKFSYERIFKPTVQNFLVMFSTSIGAIVLVAWRVKTYRDARELKFRTGQVSYRDREPKFV